MPPVPSGSRERRLSHGQYLVNLIRVSHDTNKTITEYREHRQAEQISSEEIEEEAAEKQRREEEKPCPNWRERNARRMLKAARHREHNLTLIVKKSSNRARLEVGNASYTEDAEVMETKIRGYVRRRR